MKKRQILWAIVFGSMLAITGCGDSGSSDSGDGGSGGSGGSGGPGGTGGSAGSGGTGGSGGSNGGGPAESTCEAICGATCVFGGITPGGDFAMCVNICTSDAPELDDDCGPQMEAYLDCLVGNDCNVASLDCLNQAQAWVECNEPS